VRRALSRIVSSSSGEVVRDIRFAERDRIGFLRHVAFHAVQQLVLAEDHRIVVADRLDQKALRGVGRRRAHDLEAGNVREQRREHLRVLRRRAQTRRRTSCGSRPA